MSLFEKINKFNQYISFHILGFNGFLCLLVSLYLVNEYYRLSSSSSVTWGDAYVWFAMALNAIVLSIFIIAFIVFLFERAFYFKIKNKFLIENKFLKILRYTGAVLALIYIAYNLFSLISCLVSSYLLPNKLIYYDIHAK